MLSFEITEKPQLEEVAKSLLKEIKHKVVLLDGLMGAGKTTLVKYLCEALGVKDEVTSPTFSLVNEYISPEGGLIYHFDLYRIEQEEEALDFGLEEYLYSGNYCFIEWPEKIRNLIPDEYAVIVLEVSQNKRMIKLNQTRHE